MDNQQDKILKSAQMLFGKYGMKKTSMSEIASEAGMGKATVYHYFASKEHIFAAVIEQEIMKFWLKINQRLHKFKDDPRAKLKGFFIAKMKYIKDFENTHDAFRDAHLERMPLLLDMRNKTEESEIAFVRNVLEDGITKGVFKPMDLDNTAKSIIMAIRGLEYPWLTRVPENEYEMEIDKIFDMVFKGICE